MELAAEGPSAAVASIETSGLDLADPKNSELLRAWVDAMLADGKSAAALERLQRIAAIDEVVINRHDAHALRPEPVVGGELDLLGQLGLAQAVRRDREPRRDIGEAGPKSATGVRPCVWRSHFSDLRVLSNRVGLFAYFRLAWRQ